MSRFRFWLTCIAVALTVMWPAIARAQETNPFSSCKVWKVDKLEGANVAVEGNPAVHEARLVGAVQIVCDDTTLFADEVHWRDDSDMLYASGDVVFQQKGTRISAERAEMNKKTHQGTFYQAYGILELTNRKTDKSMFGTQEPDAMFAGERIDKIADRTYKLTHASFTTCLQPTPRWEMVTSSAVLELDRHAMLKNMVLKVKAVPVFYFPAMYYPINHQDRSTGFLLPTYGSSTFRGFTLSNAFFWAIDRSQDATFYHDWYSKTGQGFGSEYRYVEAPGSEGFGRIQIVNDKAQSSADGTQIVTPAERSYNMRSQVSQALPNGIRLIGNVNYFSSVAVQQLLQQNVDDLTQRTRSFGVQVYGSWGRYRMSGRGAVTDTFYGLTSATRTGVGPQVSFNAAEKPIGTSPVYVGLSGDFASFVRQLDIADPSTNRGLIRTDVNPTVRAPLSRWPFLTVTTTASWRFTTWSQSYPTGDPNVQTTDALSRQIFQFGAQVSGPTFTRIFNTPNNGYAEKFKHVIAPLFQINRISSFADFSHVVQNDGIDQIPGGYTQIVYGLSNRLLAKRKQGQGPGIVREILSVDLTQTYYTDQTVAQYDQNYQSAQGAQPSSKFSPVRLTANGRPTDQASGQFALEYDHRAGAIRTITAGGSVNSRAVQLSAGWSKRFVIPELPDFTADRATHSLYAHTTIKQPEGHVGGMWSWNWDVQRGLLLQNRIGGFYNSQCCGVAVEFQRVNYGLQGIRGVTVDRRFNLTFTLAGIGTFSNPLGSFLGR